MSIADSVCFGFQWAKPYLTPDEMMKNLSGFKHGSALGKQTFEKLLDFTECKHIAWIVKENLKKNRLIKLDAAWVERLKTSGFKKYGVAVDE